MIEYDFTEKALSNYCTDNVDRYVIMSECEFCAFKVSGHWLRFDVAIYCPRNNWWKVFFVGRFHDSDISAIFSLGISVGVAKSKNK